MSGLRIGYSEDSTLRIGYSSRGWDWPWTLTVREEAGAEGEVSETIQGPFKMGDPVLTFSPIIFLIQTLMGLVSTV